MLLNVLFLHGFLALGQAPGVETLPAVRPSPVAGASGKVTPTAAVQDPPLGGPLGEASPSVPPPITDGLAEKQFEDEQTDQEELLLRRLLSGTALGQALNDTGIVVRGLTNGNFTASTAPKVNLPMGWNYLGNQFQLEQNSLIIEKAIDTTSDQFNWGARLYAMLPGTDYIFTAQNNLADSQARMNNGGPNTYGVDIPEFYLNGYLPEWQTSIKVGRFFSIFGTESVDPTYNRLVSRSMTYMFNPITQTGALATTRLSDNWTVFNGISAGNDVFFGPASAPMYLGGIRWDSDSRNTAIAFNTTLGRNQFNQYLRTPNLYDVFELYLSHNFTQNFNYTIDMLYSLENEVPMVGTASWYGIANYFTYTFTNDLAGTFRFEAFDDNNGFRTGYTGVYTTYSLGAVYKMAQGLWLRPEFRYDYNGTSQPYQGNNGLFTAAADFILRW